MEGAPLCPQRPVEPGLPAGQTAVGTTQAVREEADGEAEAALLSVELRTQFHVSSPGTLLQPQMLTGQA